jgi:hypothetical protein
MVSGGANGWAVSVEAALARANRSLMIKHVRVDAMVRPRFDAARRTSMSYTLAKTAAEPSDFAEYLIARLATGLDSADREPFRLAAESAVAALPPSMLGEGLVFRTVEPVWRRYFIPRPCGATAWVDGARKRASKLIEEGKRR